MSVNEQTSATRNWEKAVKPFQILDELIPKLEMANVQIVLGTDNQLLYLGKDNKQIDFEQSDKLSEELRQVDEETIKEYLRVQRVKHRNGGKYIPAHYLFYHYTETPDYRNGDYDSKKFDRLDVSYCNNTPSLHNGVEVVVHPDVTKEDVVMALKRIIDNIESGDFDYKRNYIHNLDTEVDEPSKKELEFARLAEKRVIRNVYNKSGKNPRIIGGRIARRPKKK